MDQEQTLMDFKPYIGKYRQELETVTKFWADNCLDTEYGAYFTFLDRDGSVYDTNKYMWAQWRIVYMFALLYSRGFKNDKYLAIALHGYDFLTKHGKSADGSYYFALNRQGKPIIAPYNVYSESFVVLAAATLYKVTGEEKYAAEARSAMKNYLKRINDNPKGRWNKALEAAPKRLTLGNFMILINMGSTIQQCMGDNQFEKDVADGMEYVLDSFWNKDLQVIFENINADGTFDYESCEGRMINPGHGLESLWFIMEYAERKTRPDIIEKASTMTLANMNFGWDDQYGGIFYFMDALGKPHLELQHDMKLWWVHNESILALLFAWRLTGNKKFLEWFEKLDEWTWQHFPDREYGEWYGYLNRRGEPTHLLKGGKWKTFFHLPRYLLLGIEQMQLCERGKAHE